ncbi:MULTISPECIES: Hsp20 family protein [Brenneria]|uniref:Heat-shock protein n=1 Tax=Brenneria nigrifluens DSM 30175 = ATCC 13028 TaxID=1121120 RepID=A0A2U1UQ56_9GAMM|nr:MULTISPECIES: Hsp20 family protein [Brenneria]EHD20685.1 heat shock protein Hsp20 [Brenneria sp. EniD312]PWC23777.1 heat-shock protein [Brenneria nigrifluens] [Brenneria nigrifluens DSM 30175 = ATCC 13028]QCR03862.1 heat-shock protein [Brenneria nigrifluens] [Brenneria nigrifluens DSM 30175 = ATCC 13028]
MALRTLSLFPDVSNTLFSDRFNRIDRLFSQLTGDAPLSTTPSYDIRRLDDSRYGITLSVPGWKEDELDIKTAGGQLIVSGKREEENNAEEENWLHRGIRRTDFSISYSLPEHVKVQGAALENGLLTIELYQEIPESEKPQKIAIDNRSKAIEHQA